jgi:hypothetical protein
MKKPLTFTRIFFVLLILYLILIFFEGCKPYKIYYPAQPKHHHLLILLLFLLSCAREQNGLSDSQYPTQIEIMKRSGDTVTLSVEHANYLDSAYLIIDGKNYLIQPVDGLQDLLVLVNFSTYQIKYFYTNSAQNFSKILKL